jgi:hypothetical protein
MSLLLLIASAVMQCFARPMLPMTLQQETMWIWKAMQDDACYHSILFVSKAHRAMLDPRDRSPIASGTYQQGLAIQQINQRLATSHEAIDGGTILAIVCLAVYEVGLPVHEPAMS